jgi:hypothetical protein
MESLALVAVMIIAAIGNGMIANKRQRFQARMSAVERELEKEQDPLGTE